MKGLTRNIKSTPTEPEKPILESNPSSSLVRPVEIRKEKIAPKKQPTIKETRKESLEVIVPQHVEPAPGNLETTSNGKKAMLKKVRKRKLSEHAVRTSLHYTFIFYLCYSCSPPLQCY